MTGKWENPEASLTLLVKKQGKYWPQLFSLREALGSAWPDTLLLQALESDAHEWAPGSASHRLGVRHWANRFRCQPLPLSSWKMHSVMEIKYSHTYNKQCSQSGKVWRGFENFERFEEGSRSVMASAGSRLCFRIGYPSHDWKREDECCSLSGSFLNILMPMLFEGGSLG